MRGSARSALSIGGAVALFAVMLVSGGPVARGAGSISRVAQIGSNQTTSTSSPNALSVTVGASGAPVGDTVVLGVATTGALSVSATDSTGSNTYRVDVIRAYPGSGPCTSAILTSTLAKPLVAGQKITVTLSKTSNAWGFVADDWTVDEETA